MSMCRLFGPFMTTFSGITRYIWLRLPIQLYSKLQNFAQKIKHATFKQISKFPSEKQNDHIFYQN